MSEDVVSSHRALAHPSRVRLLELVREEEEDGADVASLAARTDLHPNTVRSHLEQLVGAGLVRGVPVRRGQRGRPSIRYHAAPSDDDGGYRLLAAMLASALDARVREGYDADAEAAGRRFGRRLAAGRRRTARGDEPAGIGELFDELGFDPEPEGERITLHACPYRELARRHPDVVCGAHLGLLRGVVDAYGGHGDDAWLEPFVTPTRCSAGLVPTAATPEDRARGPAARTTSGGEDAEVDEPAP